MGMTQLRTRIGRLESRDGIIGRYKKDLKDAVISHVDTSETIERQRSWATMAARGAVKTLNTKV